MSEKVELSRQMPRQRTTVNRPEAHPQVLSVTRKPRTSPERSRRLGQARAPLTPDGVPRTARTIEFIVLERRSGASRLYPGIETDLPTLAAALLANFRTIRFPASEDGLAKSVPTRANWSEIAKARRVDRRAVDTYRDRIAGKWSSMVMSGSSTIWSLILMAVAAPHLRD